MSSKFKRYFYYNKITEETQWDYPTEKIQSSLTHQDYCCRTAVENDQEQQPAEIPSTSVSYTQPVIYDSFQLSEPATETLAQDAGSYFDPLHNESVERPQHSPYLSRTGMASNPNDLLLSTSSETERKMARPVPSVVGTYPEMEPTSAGHSLVENSKLIVPLAQSEHRMASSAAQQQVDDGVSISQGVSSDSAKCVPANQAAESEGRLPENRYRSDSINSTATVDGGAGDNFPILHPGRMDSLNLCGKLAHISAKPVICHRDTTLAPSTDVSILPPVELPPDDSKSPSVSSQHMDIGTVQRSLTHNTASSSQASESSVETLTTNNTSQVVKEKKKKKKDKSLVGGGLYMKKKNVSGLVEKWQKVQKDVECELAKEQKVAKKMEQELAALNNS
ncbi:hypothetical protein LSH36_294g00010 [Paralvinella palmiformis]|uniref:WW domain-containing protein n=1 Tax=Paralvinella palmiformis TaxID=53620 RepID=A0AAD9N3C4_9ANNE|nr:hypothetical protein LSH36_294g00010 [Paralvinella palmiformis]